MSSSIFVPAHHIGRLCASIWSINHAHCILRLVRFFYILRRNSCEIFQFMKNSLHWYPSPCIKNDYKIGLWGTLGGCMVCLLVTRVFFVYCVIQSTVDRALRRYLYTRMSLRLWLPKVRKVDQFMLATFSTSPILPRHLVRF